MGHKTGCLIIHGFGGNTHEVEPLAKHLENKGFLTFCPNLKGHTGDKKALSRVSYKDWIESCQEGLKYLLSSCERVVLIGFSMGGLVAVNLSMKYKVSAVATLSTPIYYWDIKRIFLNIIEDFKTKNFKNIRRYRRSTGSLPFLALVNFRILLQKTKPLIKKITFPLFVAQGMLDDTVNHRSAKYIYNNSPAIFKTLRYYDNSEHLICHGPDSIKLFSDIEDFIGSI